MRPLPKENGFRERLGLSDKLAVMYAGNLGLTSCLEDVLAAAELLKDRGHPFCPHRRGGQETLTWRSACEKGLGNITFLPYQPRETFPR